MSSAGIGRAHINADVAILARQTSGTLAVISWSSDNASAIILALVGVAWICIIDARRRERI